MSATNRGAKRAARDFYATPEAAFRPLLNYLHFDVYFWEPACGDGRIVRWLLESGRRACGADLHPGNGCAIIRDFLTDPSRRQFIITNPPFSLALEFCNHALTHAPEVMMLLRLNFLASQLRRPWWAVHEPDALFVLSERPSFGKNKHGRKGTDACEYAWFYWGSRFRGIHHL